MRRSGTPQTPVLILTPIATPKFVGKSIMSRVPPSQIRTLADLERTAINPRVIGALREASRRLTESGVRHAVIGALAVGFHGWPRATADVDLLVGPEAWTTAPDGSSIARVELPETIDGIGVDYLPIGVAGEFLVDAFARAHVSEGVPIAPVEAVVLTKLIRLAMRDQADIVELVKAGLFDFAGVESYLNEHAPMLVTRYTALVEQARRELVQGSSSAPYPSR